MDRNEPSLSQLIEMAKAVPFSPEAQERQRRSFAFGNVAIENPDITMEMIIAASEKLKANAEAR